ncbi:enoyl-CoA hydratase/isomerase family protein [Caldinitratiruptor microaerophilus]|uniref:Enoyl-CoA hydratase n=1 Tax=Caldinitratiruptor microaerophilus TaxID=671077 RepID=A0AA35G5P2_9FIRM|nr:enoyl-CoA hydratase/isomerase family protein [Caldinitratiruptor microaerophilus]BDG59821.1 enoyl-CoA hydratase [Caldinitratiruptor microaerophilus]
MLRRRVENGVCWLSLDRPERRNALGSELMSALEDALRDAARDPAVRAILLTGEGESFCAGGDLDEFRTYGSLDPTALYERARGGTGLLRLAFELTTPLVVAAHGHALAGGMGLVAMAHVALAAEGTVFGLTEIQVGLFPYTILPLVVRAVGPRRALELALTGRRFQAQEALGMGLVHRVVPRDQLLGAAQEVALELAGRSPVAVQTGLEAWNALRTWDPGPALDHLSLLRNVAFGSPQLRAGIERFLGRRRGSGDGDAGTGGAGGRE